MNGRNVEPVGVRGYVFGEYRIDLGGYELWQGDRPITLTPKVFDTLVVLIQHRDRAVSKEELLKSVWPDAIVTEDSLTQSVRLSSVTMAVLRRASPFCGRRWEMTPLTRGLSQRSHGGGIDSSLPSPKSPRSIRPPKGTR